MPNPGTPKQAVILAGGRGTRLMPLTATLPKPMLSFGGKPFLAYLVEMLVAEGIRRIVLLVGYLGEVIEAYFGDGAAFGVAITYSKGPVEDDTGTRMARARPLLDEVFVLVYCDNYWPMPLQQMWASFQRTSVLAQVVVYRNADAHTKHNLRVHNGLVTAYDKSRTLSDLRGVDIGFLILHRAVLDLLDEGNSSFEASVYPKLVAGGQLAAFETDHRYYSVGSHERLPLTEQFLARKMTIFLDRDGTLNRRPPPAEYVRSWADWEWLPGVLEALRLLTTSGYRILVVTNQPGIARGMMSEDDLLAIHRRMTDEAAAAGGHIEYVFYCPHGWNDGCDCRKPQPGMLYQAQRKYHLDLSRTPLIGDDERDGQAASAAGCPYWVLDANSDMDLLSVVRSFLAGRVMLRA